MDVQKHVGGRNAVRLCLKQLDEERVRRNQGSKTMTSEITDDVRAVQRWENEGGGLPPPNRVWASLKRFSTKNESRETQMTRDPEQLRAAAERVFGVPVFQGMV